MIPIRLWIVVGKGGARGDFLAGWLGTLDNAIDTGWRVEPTTGRSMGLMNCFKPIDRTDYGPDTLSELLRFRGYTLNPDSQWHFAMSCHGVGLENKLHPRDLDSVKIIHITTEPSDDPQINWELIAKTYLYKDRLESSLLDNTFYNVDREKQFDDDQQRIAYIKQRAEQFKVINLSDTAINLPKIDIPYKQIISPMGSAYLAEKLNVDITAEHHRLWVNNLSLATSAKHYRRFGYDWSPESCFSS